LNSNKQKFCSNGGSIGRLCSDCTGARLKKSQPPGPRRSNLPADFQPFQQRILDLTNLRFRHPAKKFLRARRRHRGGPK
jgi:hypothetical protein